MANTELEKHIANKYQEIDELKGTIKDELDQLLNANFELSLLLHTYKAQTKSHFTRQLANLFDISIGKVHDVLKKIKVIAKKNKVDRISLESMEIIDKPDRKNSKRKLNEKPAVLEIGELIGKIRNIQEKGISKTSKSMVRSLLEQLQKDMD
jgi:hypothetical protein